MSSHPGNNDRKDAAVEFIKLADTCQLRFDIPIEESTDIAKEFARSWTELLEAQKLTSVVSSNSHPQKIEVHVCAPVDKVNRWMEEIRQVVETLKNLPKKPLHDIDIEHVDAQLTEWQGFRLWMTFDRQQAEKFFIRKKSRRRFGSSRTYKKLAPGNETS